MKLNTNDIINRCKNKPAVFLALGGSIGKYDISEIIKDRIVITCNMWFKHFDIVPDYWVLSNTVLTVPRIYEYLKYIYRDNKPVLCYADSVDLTNRETVDCILKDCYYFPYDQRHFIGQSCPTPGIVNGIKCCEHMIEGRKTIQEELMQYCHYNEHFSTGDTVSVYAIAISVLLGCNPIDIYGLDLDYRTGYPKILETFDIEKYPFEKENKSGGKDDLFFNGVRCNINKDLDMIIKGAKNIGVEIKKNE